MNLGNRLKSNKKLTLNDLASLAGVSTSTVSRALSDNPLIKKETRVRIQALAASHNFSINTAASRLRTQKTKVVAVILNLIDHTEQSISDPFLLKIVGDLNQALNSKGYDLLLSNSFMATDNWANYFINSQRADGLIVVGQGKSDEKVQEVAESNVPLVVWGDPKTKSHYPIVGSNNRLGGSIATEHLITGGCKNILFLGDPEHMEMTSRYHGYQDALEAHAISLDTAFTVACDITSSAAYDKISELILSKGLFFDGIVACSDMVALGAMRALKERYIGIPSDVGIVGFDDILMAELSYPSLTTIKQNTQRAAQVMVNKLITQFDGKTSDSSLIDIELVARQSTKHRL
ncbi:LacI family DNA-binding transcriptional regulator [Paraglaciecola chathamensis]|uniref:Transcription regulator, LacI family protein n=1 Tax=Paraglaciecola agarilytica NO2 TaxID=1125747 RepID=A0ABQ0I3N5_9ALTE|nr:substrate-binding domain-containing protein [Paraglaciecola agarilytica]GAC03913.1 transcription regulator, LacI family protein [Paraglaciecola agarilytica NO2]